MDLHSLTELELLRMHARLIQELKGRGVVRTGNNPIGDYTEWLVGTRLGLELQPNSRASYDGIDSHGVRYQIKGRRSNRSTGDVQFSAIRNLERGGFNYLIAVAFNPDYTIRFAAKIPHSVVSAIAAYRSHVNAHVPRIRETVLERDGVFDIAGLLVSSAPGPEYDRSANTPTKRT